MAYIAHRDSLLFLAIGRTRGEILRILGPVNQSSLPRSCVILAIAKLAMTVWEVNDRGDDTVSR